MPQLIKDNAIVADIWQQISDTEDLPTQGNIIVSLARWQRERERLLAQTGQLGIHISNTATIATIATDLSHFALIALDFPVFSDGRAYSQARLLRERYGYHGEIRAVGDVLRDQIQFMSRCGINAYQLRADQDLTACLRALTEISVRYHKIV